MEEMTAKRTCPDCEKYLFRGRRKFPAETGQAEAMESKIPLHGVRACVEQLTPVKVTAMRTSSMSWSE